MLTILITLVTIYVLGIVSVTLFQTVIQAFLDRFVGTDLADGLDDFLDGFEDYFSIVLEWPVIAVYLLVHGNVGLVQKLISTIRSKFNSKVEIATGQANLRAVFGETSSGKGCDICGEGVCYEDLDTDFSDEGLNDEEYAAFLDSNDLEEEEPTVPSAPVPKIKEKKAKKSKKSGKKGKK